MRGLRWIIILLAGFICFIEQSIGQSVTIQSITISGIKHTKPSIVYRELNFAEGDTLLQKDLGMILERNQNNLYNLGLFNNVIVNISEWDTKLDLIDITIEVKESWYIYAVPIMDLADRNFNVWWTTHKRALNRLNLGAMLEWLNFTGRNDKLKAKIQFGYTPKQEIEYRFPYLNKRQSLGVTSSFSHSVNKEVNYITAENQQQFIRLGERLLQEKFQSQISTFFRPTIYLKYELAFNYQHIKMDQQVISDYNPVLFRNGDSTHTAFSVRFVYEYDDRDVKIFPSTGIKARVELEKIGFGNQDDENRLISSFSLEWNAPLGRRFQHRASVFGQYSLSRSRPSYMYYNGLGSDQRYISGYELYAIDGLDLFGGKYQFTYKILEKEVKVGRLMPFEQFRRMPMTIYASMSTEVGYVKDPFTGSLNSFTNRWLYGGGPGIGFLLYNNFLFQFNYSTNHLGEWGLFIHNRTSF